MIQLLLSRLAQAAAWTLARTWRLEVIGADRVNELRGCGIPAVSTVWHANLLPPLWDRRGEGIALLVSDHADAGYLARAALRWGYRVVRGSTTRGAVRGLRAVVRILAAGGDVAFTPDGPRGPARRAKPGALGAAWLAGAAVVPIGVAASSEWQLRSWDRFTIPRPFSRVRVVYGSPIRQRESRRNNGAEAALLANRLDVTQREAECP